MMEGKTKLLQGLLDKVSGLSVIKNPIHYVHSKNTRSDRLRQGGNRLFLEMLTIKMIDSVNM